MDNSNDNPKQGACPYGCIVKVGMCCHMAGKRGGDAVARKYGQAHYSAIGKKGGAKVRDVMARADPNFYKRNGEIGGARVTELYGKEYFEQIGKKGGDKLKKEKGPEYYQRLGKLGGAKVKAAFDKANNE